MITGIINWSLFHCSDTIRNFTADPNSMIAVLKADKKTAPDLTIRRFLIEEPYRYPFFYPRYFSDSWYLDLQNSDSLIFLLDNKDTLLSGGAHPVTKVPSEIKVYNYSNQLITTYHPGTIYNDNMSTCPKISFFRQFVFWGSSREGVLDKCN